MTKLMREEEILKQVLFAFSNTFSTKSEVRWGNGRVYDAIIYYKTIPYVVVELKTYLNEPHSICNRLFEDRKVVNCYWCMVTDGSTCYLQNMHEELFQCSLNDAILKIQDIESIRRNIDDTKLQEVVYVLTKYGHEEFVNKLELVPTADSQPVIVFDSSQTEMELFETIIGKPFNTYDEKIHKYTSLRTAFEMINQCSFRMNGIAGMNDNSEGYYWDEAVTGKKQEPKDTINDYFISSFSTEYDNLTLWRLYGDDGKGVCLTFKVIKGSEISGMTLGAIKYMPKDDSNFEFFRTLDKTNFVYQDIEQWKCFFKSQEYKEEKEYRLMLKKNENDLNVKESGYYITNSNSIINPYVTLNMNSGEFPLELKTITFGPKFPEQKVNQLQLFSLLRSKGLYRVKIQESNVITYR